MNCLHLINFLLKFTTRNVYNNTVTVLESENKVFKPLTFSVTDLNKTLSMFVIYF